jgi:hypothetical protein
MLRGRLTNPAPANSVNTWVVIGFLSGTVPGGAVDTSSVTTTVIPSGRLTTQIPCSFVVQVARMVPAVSRIVKETPPAGVHSGGIPRPVLGSKLGRPGQATLMTLNSNCAAALAAVAVNSAMTTRATASGRIVRMDLCSILSCSRTDASEGKPETVAPAAWWER